jgi:RNA polymerase sigma-70 factor (ECF subfamily)
MLRRSRVRAENPAEANTSPNEHSLHRFYEDNLPVIYRFIYSKVGNREEAEDLTSQVFIKALHGLDEARDAQSVQSWLFQVARTTLADHWRQYYRLRTDSLDILLAGGWEAAAEGSPAPDPPDERVRRLLQRLPPRYREVLTYRFLLNCSIKETADTMLLTEANVKVLQFRALKKAAQLDVEGC